MKLILVDNLIMPEEGSLATLDVHPHLGLLALAAVAEAAGHVVRIYDPKRLVRSRALPYDATLYDRVADELLAWSPDAVGFTALGCSFLFALNVAGALKRRQPVVPVLLGGPHATMLHRQILERFAQIDIVVRHEADETLPAVLDGLDQRRFDRIPGISWRAADRAGNLRFTEGRPKVADLDSLPLTSYDHYPVRDLGLELLRIEAGRGCPFSCTFCSTAGFFQRSFRLKSADRLVRELDLLHARYGFREFKLDHDMFTVNRRKVLEFCDAVRGRGYRWRASARVDGVDNELLARMADAGCAGLYFGIETGSARMQRICQKRLDLDLVLPILAETERLGIETTASFITGYPEELEQDLDQTLDMLGQCFTPSGLVQLHALAPEPGTPMFEQHGHALKYDGYGGPYNAALIGPNDESLILEHPDIFQTYYHYPAAMPRQHHIFAVEAVAMLRRLGPILLNYLLRAYGGRLAALVREMMRFAEGMRVSARPDADLVEAYVRSAFGPSHHLSSLVRFAFRANRGGWERALPVQDHSPAVYDPERRYQLGAGVEFLEDIHDCAVLLEGIRREPSGTRLLDASEAGDLGVYLVTRFGGTTASYRIEPGVQAILSLFQEPQSCRDVMRAVGESMGAAPLEHALFAQLVSAHVLVASDAPRVDVPLESHP